LRIDETQIYNKLCPNQSSLILKKYKREKRTRKINQRRKGKDKRKRKINQRRKGKDKLIKEKKR